MNIALITGIAGQDGSYMAEFLTGRGYRVVGLCSDKKSLALENLSLIIDAIELVTFDLADHRCITDIVSLYRPTEIFNFAAYSTGVGMYDHPVNIADLNGLAVTSILEAIRSIDTNIRFCQASSSEMFGDAIETPQNESTRFTPRSPYGAAKLYAHEMIRIYRQRYGLFACSAILFNHESPRRSLDFVTRKITHNAAMIKLGLVSELQLGNIDSRRDWGYAKDYVRGMSLMLQASAPDDYVLSTGETHSVREVCEVSFNYLGLDYRQFVRENSSSFRPIEPIQLVGNSEKAKKQLGWEPEMDFSSMIKLMVDSDIQQISANESKSVLNTTVS